MAEERSKKLYGKSPKIVPADGPAGEEREAVSKVKATAGEPEVEQPAAERKAVDATEAGAGSISMSDMHAQEFKDMHTRHEREYRDMHTRHEQERKETSRRQAKGMAKQSAEHVDGTGGTEPE